MVTGFNTAKSSLKLIALKTAFKTFQTAFGEDTFVVIEKWESLPALMAHAVSPHMKDYGKRSKDLIADRVIHVLSPTS